MDHHSDAPAADRPFTHRPKRAGLAGLMAIVGACLVSGAADAEQPEIKATHGAWQISCGTPPGARDEKCSAIQSVTAEDRPNIGLTVIFLKTSDGKRQLLRVIAPLGVLLPTGLGLKVDDADVGRAPFVRCGNAGCVAEVEPTADLLTKLQGGKTAVFIIFQTPEAGIGIPISLQGFGDALASLK